jgi:hypothetical protein
LELNEKLTSLGDIDLCGNYLTNIEGFHFMDGSTQKTGLTQTTIETRTTTTAFDICEIKRNNHYINKSSSGVITWNIYVDKFSPTIDATMFYFINNTGQSQQFYFIGDPTNTNIYDPENNKLDVNTVVTIESSRIRILYTTSNHFTEKEMYICIE